MYTDLRTLSTAPINPFLVNLKLLYPEETLLFQSLWEQTKSCYLGIA